MKKTLLAVASATLLLSSTFVASASAASAPQGAEVYPTKPVRLVVAFPIAGATDILARHFALTTDGRGRRCHVQNCRNELQLFSI